MICPKSALTLETDFRSPQSPLNPTGFALFYTLAHDPGCPPLFAEDLAAD